MANYLKQEAVIYGLRRPGTTAIRYVGRTTRGEEKRMAGHYSNPPNEAMGKWLARLDRDGLRPEFIVLAKATGWTAHFIEIDWIRSVTAIFGKQVFNIRERGDFVPSCVLRRKSIRFRKDQECAAWDKFRKVRTSLASRTIEQTESGREKAIVLWRRIEALTRDEAQDAIRDLDEHASRSIASRNAIAQYWNELHPDEEPLPPYGM